MTDLELAAKKLSEVETYLAEIRLLGRPELVATDLREPSPCASFGLSVVGGRDFSRALPT